MDLASRIVKLNSQTNGRDKVYRTCQYGCKLVWWCLEQQQEQDQDVIKKLKLLEGAMSTCRKMLRLGKSIDFMQAAMKSIHIPDVFRRVTITLAKLNQAFYLLFDHFIWAHNIGIVKIDKPYYSNLSCRFWLATLILNISRDLYEITSILDAISRQNCLKTKKKELEPATDGNENGDTAVTEEYPSGSAGKITSDDLVDCFFRQNLNVTLDTVKNGADLFLPLSALGYVNISPGMVGLCGLISSLAALATVWNTKLKLSP